MQSIIIGRTPHGQQKQQINEKSVSRQHAKLTKLDNNKFEIEDIGSSYGTYVNGLPVVKTIVDLDTPIILADFSTSVRELLGLSAAKEVQPAGGKGKETESISVAHLQRVYEDYLEAVKNMAKKKSKAQVMRMMPMQLGMPLVLGACGFLPNDQKFLILKGVLMVGIMALNGLLSFRMVGISTEQADEQYELNKQFQIKYVCPKCGSFFGQTKPYEALLNQGQCPYCKSKFIESGHKH